MEDVGVAGEPHEEVVVVGEVMDGFDTHEDLAEGVPVGHVEVKGRTQGRLLRV